MTNGGFEKARSMAVELFKSAPQRLGGMEVSKGMETLVCEIAQMGDQESA